LATPTPQTSGDHTVWRGKHTQMILRDGWEFVQRRGATGCVGILAVTPENRVVLVEQFRPALNKFAIELPAGLVGDLPGAADESLAEGAKRELLEETGYAAETMTRLIEGAGSAGITDELITLFLATGLRKVSAGGGEGAEQITVHEVGLSELRAWVQRRVERGGVADLKIFSAIALARDIGAIGG
jgi:ADP-ribose pyrophosphatase